MTTSRLSTIFKVRRCNVLLQTCLDAEENCLYNPSTDDEEAHKLELATLAEKDPVFYKYLQENDKELLSFSIPDVLDVDAASDNGGFEVNGEDDEMESNSDSPEDIPVLTADILRGWQKAIIEVSNIPAQCVHFRTMNHLH